MSEIDRIRRENKLLKEENERLKQQFRNFFANDSTVTVPSEFQKTFEKAQKIVQKFFLDLKADPSKAEIAVNASRYILIRGSSLSLEFFNKVMELYSDRGEEKAWHIARNLLFDIAHVLGSSDAKNFHQEMKLNDPVERLSAGPVHFAFTGWASVEIHADSRPTPDKDFYLHYDHHHSFEAEAWIKEKRKPPFPVCVMNAAYSSGWCADSFEIPLTAVEVSCRARGDKACSFIMAPPDQIHRYLDDSKQKHDHEKSGIPLFFERKRAEEKLRATLEEKDLLLKELHHRVKNNLQIISSLISLKEHQERSQDKNSTLEDLKQRVTVIGLIHERLYRSDDVTNVDFAEYLESIVKGVHAGLCSDNGVKLSTDIPDDMGKLSIEKAISCGLLINEGISNACKYAFPDNNGTISINARKIEGRLYLEVVDDGIGIGEATPKGGGMGMELMEALADQLDAQLKIISSEGTRIMFNFSV